jgi:DNA-binding MarR family transcriptional regulator
MNIKNIENNLDNVKKICPEIYRDTMRVSVPFFVLHKHIYTQGDELMLNELDITQSELDVIATLYLMGGDDCMLSPTKLYELMIFSSGGMTKLLKKLESRELITRVDNSIDKRSKLVQITQHGKDIARLALDKVVALEDKYFSKLSQDEQDKFVELINKMLK